MKPENDGFDICQYLPCLQTPAAAAKQVHNLSDNMIDLETWQALQMLTDL